MTVSFWGRRWSMSLAAILCLQVLVFSCGCADSLLLHPSRDAYSSTESLARREIQLASGTLEVWIARSPSLAAGVAPSEYVLAFDGNASRAESAAPRVAELLADRSVEVWAVNYPGYGGSSGEAELDRLGPTALVAYDELARVAGRTPVAVYGSSLGSTVALHVVTKRPVAYAVLQNPPPLRRMILMRYGWWNLWLVAMPIALSIPGELESISSAEVARAPAVFVTAQADSIVPPSYQSAVFDAYGGPKRRVFTDGGHNDALSPETMEAVRAELRTFTSTQ